MSASTPDPYIIETTEPTFERDVIERSRDVPVVVDFWAPWCQPCRVLGPILEKLALEKQGAFVLVKADIEQMPNIAAAFRVRSIPAVFAIKNGRAVDSFLGLLGEAAIRSWIDAILPTPAEEKVVGARRIEAEDPSRAEALYREALTLAPSDPAARIGLARVLLQQKRFDEAQKLITELEGRGFLEPEAERLKAELNLRAGDKDAGDLASLRADAAAHPDDPAIQLRLAEALAAAGQYAESLERALAVVEDAPRELREAARKLMVSIFQLLPEDSELASEYRRKLSAALY